MSNRRRRPRLRAWWPLVVLPALLLAGPGSDAAAPMPPPVVPVGAFGWPMSGVDTAVDGGPPARAGSEGTLTRRFEPPPHRYGRGHRGADLAGAPGTVVRSAGAGTVAFAGLLAGRGVVSVDHPGGLRTTYEPVTPGVVAGAPVARGGALGILEPGHRGCPVAACLHWGLRRSGPDGLDYLDPLLLVGLGRARLLPWPP